MMDSFNIKKYTVALFVCFLSFFGIVNAETEVEETQYSLTYNKTQSIYSKMREGFTCKGESLNHFTLSANNSGGYTVQYAKTADSQVTEKVTCSWTADPMNGAGAGSKDYYFTTDLLSEVEYTMTVSEKSPSANIGERLGLGKIDQMIEVSSDTGAEKLFTVVCKSGSKNCTATLNGDGIVALKNKGDGFYILVRVKFTPANSEIPKYANVKVAAKTNTATKAYPGDVGTCKFTSEWDGQDKQSSGSGQRFSYYQSLSGNAQLPTCVPDNNYLQFKGWKVYTSTGDHVNAVGQCKSALQAGATAEAGVSYAACYEAPINMAVLAVTAGDLSSADKSIWTSQKNDGHVKFLIQNNFYTSGVPVYFRTSTTGKDKVKLPSSLVFTGNDLEAGRALDGWINTTTGEIKLPGEEITISGNHVWSAVVSGSGGLPKNRNKTVYVGEEVVLSDSQYGYGSMCSSADTSYVTASFAGGKCKIKGVKATSSGSTVDVTLMAGDAKIVYKVTVIQSVGQSQGGDSEFVIDTTPNIIIGENDDESDGVSTDMCDTYRITFRNKAPWGKNAEEGFTYPNHGLNSSIYSVTPLGDCNKDAKYVSLCLDPGLQGPKGNLYIKDEEINLKNVAADSDNERFGKAIQEIINHNLNSDGSVNLQIFDDVSSNKRIAAHIAIRLVALETGKSAGEDVEDVLFKAAYEGYYRFSQDYEIGDSESEIENHLNNNFVFNTSTVKDEVKEILANFMDNSGASSNLEETKVVHDKKDAVVSGNGYEVLYEGTITLPPGAEAEDLIECDSNNGMGVQCVKESFAENGTVGEGNDVRKVYAYKVKMVVPDTKSLKLPSSKDEERKISFKLKLKGAAAVNNIVIAKPADGANLQRMLVFDLGDPNLYVYFPPYLDKLCDLLPELNADNCQGPDQCDNFNAQLFKQAGCCEEITDESANTYVVDFICNGKCTSNTFVEVCEFNQATVGNADLYDINEGTYRDFEKGTQEDDYHECIVNVADKYNTDGGLSSNPTFKRLDDVGESRNVDHYEDNKYCQVTCKEDWEISMDAFGNYVGENAVAAGSYFQIVNNDVFMSGKRTCFTSFIDYDQYMKDLVELSEKMVKEYNVYSEASHLWTDLENSTYNTDHVSYSISDICDSACDITDCCDSCPKGSTKTCCPAGKTYSCPGTSSYYVSITVGAQGGHVSGVSGKNYSRYVGTDKNTTDRISGNEYEIEQGKTGTLSDTMTWGQEGENCQGGCPGSNKTGPKDTLDGYSFNEVDGDNVRHYVSASNAGITFKYSEESDARTAAETTIYEAVKKQWQEKLQNIMDTSLQKMVYLKTEIETRSKHMFNCQHFIQYNLSDEREGREGKVELNAYDNTLFGKTENAIQIDTSFEPKAAYTYDEKAFMTILGKDNVLEMYDYKNHKLYGGSFETFQNENAYDKATEKIEKITLTNYDGSNSGEEVELARNAMETIIYYPKEIWKADSDAAKKYDESSNKTVVDVAGDGSYSTYGDNDYEEKIITFCNLDIQQTSNTAKLNDTKLLDIKDRPYEWTAETGGCYNYKIKYVKAHYIKNSIKNSSFYRNKGYWFNRASDVKEHGDTLKEALQNGNNANNRSVNYPLDQNELSRWTLLGTYNVFPVSMTTPRNLYQYTYSFGDIGSYNDGKLGRIMGADKSIISFNTRTCFYEVYEEICLCCGDEINTHVDNDPADKTDDFLNGKSGSYKYDKSILDNIVSNKDGSISFATSSVSLGDAYKGSDPADNWSNTSKFTYNGNNNLATDKGSKLLNEIETMGENVYDESPEYSFFLDTTTLAAIREYNDNFGYDVNYGNLKVYGRVSIVPVKECTSTDPTSCEWTTDDETMNNTIINFQHFGSVFLEEVLPSMGNNVVQGNTLSLKTGNNNVCVIDYNDIGNGASGDVLTRLAVGSNSNNGCRWIDYIENMDAVKSNAANGTKVVNKVDPATGRTEKYYRMAFK